ncbi:MULTISPECIES: hypothetical protein [unclassified Legionella]|uniref:hypothetical protein n=1 Tax=unclassified Legionella TaxID=2622702 RepID=UPI0010542C87|nr:MULTISPECIES: hypothetical protein [unclassified Legionella]MDI9818499.1 hypothetical protein [Legionella sp. PL877]
MSSIFKFNSLFRPTEAVKQTAEAYRMRIDTVGRVKQIKALAQNGNAMAQYKLASFHPKNSRHYKEWMEAAAEQGCTNAMLAWALALAEKGGTGNLQQAVNYLVRVLCSDDSFIKTEARAFLAGNRLLATEVSRQMTKFAADSSITFFAAKATTAEAKQQPFVQESLQIKSI